MGWSLDYCVSAAILSLSCSLSSSLASPDNSSLISASRKFFFADDNHENIDDLEQHDYNEQYYDDSLPFGNFEMLEPSQVTKTQEPLGIGRRKKPSKARITIQQFIDKLKQIQNAKGKTQPKKNFKKPEKTDKTSESKKILTKVPKVSRSKPSVSAKKPKKPSEKPKIGNSPGSVCALQAELHLVQ